MALKTDRLDSILEGVEDELDEGYAGEIESETVGDNVPYDSAAGM